MEVLGFLVVVLIAAAGCGGFWWKVQRDLKTAYAGFRARFESWKSDEVDRVARVEAANQKTWTLRKADLDLEKSLHEESVQRRAREMAGVIAQSDLAQWKLVEEARIRSDAVVRSSAVNKGRVAEQFLPFSSSFGFNPKDARFLGSPHDLIVYEGLTDGDLRKIIFMEVKTGHSQLSDREKQIRRAVEGKLVEWREVRLDAPSLTTAPQGLAA